ncbi:hypothetical protein [Streptomyces sp. 2323.1]|uniref:hypothetical protein n=1 Tax=Streptomyces sp. 2323.1 TaxID=1938841 RepID=UPI0013317801|nr:hypothetical protein [Streptomyces sp. 2323.1]
MAARKAIKKPAAQASAGLPCPDCKAGQNSETFQVGARKKRDSPDKQEALCLTCWGTGEVPTT